MSIKVIATDLDGTLTNSKKELTPHTQNTLKKAMDLGVKVVLASGRPYYGVKNLAQQLQLEQRGGYILCFNGAKLVNCQTKKVLFEQTIPQQEIEVLDYLARHYHSTILTYTDDTILTTDPDDEYVQKEWKITGMKLQKVETFSQVVTFPVNKCMMVGEGSHMAQVEQQVQLAVGGRLSVYRSEPFFLEIMPAGINKARSLEFLLNSLGCDKDELMAFGDGYNDLSMIGFAGLGVAVANAQKVILDAADYVSASNDEDGVAQAVEKFVLELS